MDKQGAVAFNTYKDVKGHIISLDREIARFEKADENLKQAGFSNISRWKATDYKEEDVNREIRLMGAKHLENFVNDAEIALTLSHFRIMHNFLASQESHCLIFEDDVVLHPDFSSLSNFNDINYGEFDLLSFGGIFVKYQDPITGYIYRHIHEAPSEKTHITDCDFWCTHAYMITREAAHKALMKYGEYTEGGGRPQIDMYLCHNRQIKTKLISNRNIPDITQYSLGERFSDRLCGIAFQEGSYASTIQQT
jgi:hypothetical protein